ncbi:Oligopeptide-binding protein AppA [Bacillus paralicheniformis]|uniref:peptide-binding protein n=1 Tax=Bacillus paralicheniformis TaxID=1648923 RepID=UPI0011BD8E06|nr:peptide-binding protein [Bacillus paralicheniformis]TWK91313.1 Oligopeptide-binding protein AppA [Bacillus paralicheniformis]
MNKRKTGFSILSLLLILSIFLTACNSGEVGGDEKEGKSDGKPQQGGDLVIGSTGEPTMFNALYSTDVSSSDIEGFIFDGLVGSDTDLNPTMKLAEKIDQSEDGITYNVTLKKGVKWHDGEEFTADDVVFTYNIPLSKDYAGERGSNFGMIDKVTKKGDYEVEFKLKHPDPSFLPVSLSYGILPEHILGDVPIKDLGEHEFNRKKPIGTGPFKFVEWKQGQYVKVEAFEDYYGEGPYLDTLTYKVIPDANAAIAQLQAGDINYFVVPGTDVKTVEKFDHVKLESDLGLNYSYLGWNEKNELFKDKKVRQALTHAIDRESIVQNVLDGDGEVANIPESPLSWNYPKDIDIPVFEYDPAKAKKMLKEAGWEDTDGDGILDKDGKKFSFTIKTNQGNKVREDAAVVIQQQLKEVGIEAKPQIVEFSALIEQTSAPNWNYDALLLGWSLATFPDQYDIFHSSQSKAGLNNIWYKNEEVDKLLVDAKKLKDRKEYSKAYEKIYKMIAEDQPYTFLFYYNYHRAIPKNLKGFEFHPKNDFYEVNKWWLKK